MARLPYPDLESLPHDAAAAIAALPAPANVITMIAHAPALVRPIVSSAVAMRTALRLPPRLRELIILMVAHETECPYEWEMHLPQAKADGVMAEDLALVTDASRVSADPATQAVLTAARAYLRGEAWDDGTVAELNRYLSDREIVETVLLLGFVRMGTFMINSLGIEPDHLGEAFTAAHREGRFQGVGTPGRENP